MTYEGWKVKIMMRVDDTFDFELSENGHIIYAGNAQTEAAAVIAARARKTRIEASRNYGYKEVNL